MHNLVWWLALVLLIAAAGVTGGVEPPAPDSTRKEASAVTLYAVRDGTSTWQWHRDSLPWGSWFGVVRSAEELERLLTRRAYLRDRIPQDVAWGKELLVIASLGEAPTGGYAVKVRDVTCTGGSILVRVALKSPAPDTLVTQMITYPVDVVRLPTNCLPEQIDWVFVGPDDRLLATM